MEHQNRTKILQSLNELKKRKLWIMAEEQCLGYLESNPGDEMVRAELAEVYWNVNDFGQSLTIYEKLLEEHPHNKSLMRQAALAAMRCGMVSSALAHAKAYRDVVGDTPESISLRLEIYERNNMVAEAKEMLGEATKLGVDRPALDYYQSRILLQDKRYDDAIDLMRTIVSQERYSSSDEILAQFWFLLTKAYDRTGEYDLAWSAAESAHNSTTSRWHQKGWDDRVESILNTFDREMVDSMVRAPSSDERPIFIVGNPRSGTSLLEQILGMHSQIDNGGEMSVSSLMEARLAQLTDSFQPWPVNLYDMRAGDAEQLLGMYTDARRFVCPDAPYVTNKSLVLEGQLGFLSLLFDKAKAINLHRHPLDNCVSCYTTPLHHAGHSYASNLESLAKVWIGRRRLKDHWASVIDMPILELHYEQLVSNQEAETRRLIEFLEVPWEDGCMEFHTSKKVARTISYDQVNQKMYTSSSGRWMRYEKHLGPLIDLLSDYL